MQVIRYHRKHKDDWDAFIRTAKNYHFFFHRDYMEYHSDQFEDYSLLVYDEKEKLIAVLPANRSENEVHSHQGLTFGGFLTNDRMKMVTMLKVFDAVRDYLKQQKLQKLVYKCIPHIYHIAPAEEDLYALFRNEAKLVRRDVTSTLSVAEQVSYSKAKKWRVNKAGKLSIEVSESDDYPVFWDLLTASLEKNHQTRPVHSADEMQKLAKLFPENIRLFVAKRNKELLSGALVYVNPTIAHTQYLASSANGKEVGALNVLLDHLIQQFFANKQYFDFGISNEDAGKYLNSGLIGYKEGFGARAVVHDFYEMIIR